MAFGFPKVTQASAVKPQYAGNEKLMLLGALLRDLSTGQGPETLLGTQKYLADNARQRQRLAATADLDKFLTGAGGYRGIGPGVDGEPLDARAAGQVPTLRQALPKLLAAAGQGVDIGDRVSLLDKAGPSLKIGPNGEVYDERDTSIQGRNFSPYTYESGLRVNANRGDAPDFIPQFDKGQEPLFDSRGQIVAIRNIDGSVQSAAEMAGAVEGAKAAATAPYQDVTVQGPNGAPITMSRQRFAGAGPIVGRAPEVGKAAEARAVAQATAGQELGGAVQTAQSALDTIGQIRIHPGLKSRVGVWAVAPAIPGTPGKDFDALVEQAKGQVFLQAYSALKGGGQITEREGQAAQQAIARLNQAQTQEGFMTALDDLEGIIRKGVERAQSKAGAARPQITPEQARAELARRRAAQGR